MLGAIGTALAAVPWSTVIDKAPGIVDQATSLYARIRSERGPTVDPLVTLVSRINQLESEGTERESQVLEISQLVQQLAEQNRSLSAVVASSRRWIALALVGSAASIVLAGIALVT
ncbi:MAG: hypothetical protein V4537_13015 [Pseudomonadota bacterium]